MTLLGVLDQSPIRSGGTTAGAVHETLERAQAADHPERERFLLQPLRRRPLAGAPGQVWERLTEVAAAHGGEELLIATITHADFKARRRSYERLAEMFGLRRRESL